MPDLNHEAVDEYSVPVKGYDSEFELPGRIYFAPIVVTGDEPTLDAYLKKNGLERVMPITRDGHFAVPGWDIRPQPGSDKRLANLLTAVAQKEQRREAPVGTYRNLIYTIIQNATDPRQAGQ